MGAGEGGGEVIVAHIKESAEQGGGVTVRRFLKGKLLGKVRSRCGGMLLGVGM